MGKIIYYDFRKEERQKEMNAIQIRMLERLAKPNLAGYNTPEAIRQAQEDRARYLELELEQNEIEQLIKTNKGGETK